MLCRRRKRRSGNLTAYLPWRSAGADSWNVIICPFIGGIREKCGDGEMSLEKLKESLEEDIKRNQIIQNWQPGRYLEGEYMKWIANKQLKAFYEELKK